MAHLMALPKQDRLRVLAADSTAMGTQLLVEALARDAQFEMIESPSEAAAILNLVEREKPQVVVISAKLGEDHTGGVDLLRELRSQSPSPRVIMLLDTSEREAVIAAFRAGAQGVFCRTEPFRLLAKCIQCVDAGQVWASSSELQFVLEALTQPALAHLSSNGKVAAFGARNRCRPVFGGRTHQPRNRPASQAYGTHGQELSISYFRQVGRVQPGRGRALCFGRWCDARSEGLVHR